MLGDHGISPALHDCRDLGRQLLTVFEAPGGQDRGPEVSHRWLTRGRHTGQPELKMPIVHQTTSCRTTNARSNSRSRTPEFSGGRIAEARLGGQFVTLGCRSESSLERPGSGAAEPIDGSANRANPTQRHSGGRGSDT